MGKDNIKHIQQLNRQIQQLSAQQEQLMTKQLKLQKQQIKLQNQLKQENQLNIQTQLKLYRQLKLQKQLMQQQQLVDKSLDYKDEDIEAEIKDTENEYNEDIEPEISESENEYNKYIESEISEEDEEDTEPGIFEADEEDTEPEIFEADEEDIEPEIIETDYEDVEPEIIDVENNNTNSIKDSDIAYTETSYIIDEDIDIISDDDNIDTPYLVEQEEEDLSAEELKAQKKKTFAKEVFSWVKMILIAVCVAIFINFVILFNGTVPSGSMSPTIEYPSRIIGFRLSYLFSEPERGDIIIFQYPDDTSQNFVKRIIGLPGETVEIIDGEIYISDSDGNMIEDPLDESDYITEEVSGDFGPYEVPAGSYFVLGDNRDDSLDSRYWENTYVSEDEILAKAIVQYWPDVWLLE